MEIHQLVEVEENKRDHNWENQFFQKLTSGQIEILSDEPQSGPDGWPYLLVKTSENATDPTSKVLTWLKDKGIGLVVNPQKDYPDYVFTYGMIWHFCESGLFFKANQTSSNGQAFINLVDIKESGDAPESYFPKYARAILREFFQSQGILMPKLLVVNLKSGSSEFILSQESLGNPPESEHQGIAEAVSWFLPPQFSIVIMSERGLPEFFAV